MILIINDDGFNQVPFDLYEAIVEKGFECKIVIPAGNFSFRAHTISNPSPSYVDVLDKINSRQERHWEKDIPYIVVDGTPVDCLRYALRIYKKIDFVVAGPNLGFNAGMETLVSSTIAIAREALSWGKRSVALSLESPVVMQSHKQFIGALMTVLLEKMPEEIFLNINIPNNFKNIVFCPLATANLIDEEYNKERESTPFYTENGDVKLLKEKNITVTPLGIQLYKESPEQGNFMESLGILNVFLGEKQHVPDETVEAPPSEWMDGFQNG